MCIFVDDGSNHHMYVLTYVMMNPNLIGDIVILPISAGSNTFNN